MPVKARDLKRMAIDHQRKARTEAERRAVVSRGYYASYHRCLRWEEELTHKSSARPYGGCHEQLIERLAAPSPMCEDGVAERSHTLSMLLDAQRARRITADYELTEVVDEDAMKAQIEACNAVFQTCGE